MTLSRRIDSLKNHQVAVKSSHKEHMQSKVLGLADGENLESFPDFTDIIEISIIVLPL